MIFILFNIKSSILSLSPIKTILNQSILNIDDTEIIQLRRKVVQLNYHAFFDITIVNEDIGRCFANLFESIDSLKAEPQWVPIRWLY